MEFRGTQTDGSVADNTVQIDLAFYVNDCGRNALRLPLLNAPTHMGPFYAADNNSVATLKCRGLGIPGVPGGLGDPTVRYNLPSLMPDYSLRISIEMKNPRSWICRRKGVFVGDSSADATLHATRQPAHSGRKSAISR